MSEARKREGGAANVQRASCIVPVGAAVWFRGAAVLAALRFERGTLGGGFHRARQFGFVARYFGRHFGLSAALWAAVFIERGKRLGLPAQTKRSTSQSEANVPRVFVLRTSPRPCHGHGARQRARRFTRQRAWNF